ncbi:MAG: UDP binding domain-containing protein, partial [Thermoanaerobaculia bacterium]|nr:UDP binding domain-containing protein [Thermoanaerobaculia bacterium]
KDLEALVELARGLDIALPLLEGVTTSNRLQVEQACRVVGDAARRTPGKIGFVGLAFKPGTDDLRRSPSLAIIRHLLRDGFEVGIFDDSVDGGSVAASGNDGMSEVAARLEDDLSRLVRESRVLVVDDRFLADREAEVPDFGDTVVIELNHALSGLPAGAGGEARAVAVTLRSA